MAKQTQKDILIELFQRNGYMMTLGELLRYPVGYKAASRFSDLRKMGWTITCEKGKCPSDNIYRAAPPMNDGQMRFIA